MPAPKGNQYAKGHGNPGAGKLHKLLEKLDKFSDLYWETWEEMMTGTDKADKKFAMDHYKSYAVKRMPTVVQGDEEGGPLQVQLVNYSNTYELEANDSAQIPTENVSTAIPPSDGQGGEESGPRLA